MLPKFMIIGAMKCGTTSLFSYLSHHPRLVPSVYKETDFFISDKSRSKGISWYESRFRGDGDIAFESSPNYTKKHLNTGVPERIHAVIPDIKLIFIIREPLERIKSHFLHSWSSGKEKRSFSEVLKDSDNNYFLTTKYYEQILPFLKLFPKENIKLIISEDLRASTKETVKSICEFISVDFEIDDEVFESSFNTSNNRIIRTSLTHSTFEINLEQEQFINSFFYNDLRMLEKEFGIVLPY